ncbi:MAG TPA: asparagine synthase (glutamine-hydrolyzing) [Vicinamibacterales bacterium]
MCGIAGTLSLSGRPVDSALVSRMGGALAHRGPDERGLHVDTEVGLAHTRLSIIDLAGGHQPMSLDAGRLWVTFNGEIFNYIELRDQLLGLGHRFTSRSDTEVILHLYDRYGPDCVRMMNGQWALAIWDPRRRRLFLSRDRMGVRPLFYAHLNGVKFSFASEVKALFQDADVPRALDLEALDQVFTFWSPLSSRTIFTGIHELAPGHSLTVEDGCVRTWCYWKPQYESSMAGSSQALSEELQALLVDATRIRLRADVPVGAYLSGGLDSSVTAALVKRFTTTPLRTFSVAFDDAELDESWYQRQMRDALLTDHESLRCAASDIGRVFPEVIWHTETPVLRTAPAPLMLLSRLVSERGYKVVLTGEGADEVLGGYDIFKETKIRRFWAAQPQSLRRPLLLRRLYPYMSNVQAQPLAYLRAFFKVTERDLDDPFFSHLPRWELTSRLKCFYSDATRDRLGDYDAVDDLRSRLPSEYAGWDTFSRAQYLEAAHLLPGYILSSQGDRMAMANAVEGRFPFLDHRVVEFSNALHPTMKMKVLTEKHLLKRAARDLVPDVIVNRQKQPYRAPDARSFLDGGQATPEYVDELLSEQRLRADGVFDSSAVQRLVAKIRGGRAIGVKDNMALVGILSTQLLIELFIRTPPHAHDSERGTAVHRGELLVRAGLN